MSCGSTLWRTGGSRFATVFVKATFGLVHGGPARLIAPVDLVRNDRHRDGSPANSLEDASETAPYLPGAGVVLRGHAHAPSGRPVPAMSVRLAIFRDRPLLDKTLHIFGDRTPQSASSPLPFQRVPIVYERAYGGAGVEENPVGVGADAATRSLPNIVDPADARKPAGFGPISRYWASRKRMLGAVDRRSLEPQGAEIPEGFDWRYFHAAPADQQIEPLAGDEWIVLDGLNASLPRLQARLPSARGLARWFPVMPSGVAGVLNPIELVADTLIIDSDRQLGSVIWRGNFPFDPTAAAHRVCVLAGVELPGFPLTWPDPKDVPAPSADEEGPPSRGSEDAPASGGGRPAAPAARRSPVVDELSTTRDPDAHRAQARPVTPFQSRSSAPAKGPAAAGSAAPDDEKSTRMMSVAEITARGRGSAVPFAPSAPVAGGRSPQLAIPGAPFSPPKVDSGQGGPPQEFVPVPGLSTTVGFDSQNIIGSILPFSPTGAPGGPAPPREALGTTAPIDVRKALSALPFQPADPQRPAAIAPPAGQPSARGSKPLTGTAEFKLPTFPGAELPFNAGRKERAGSAGSEPAEPPPAATAPPAMALPAVTSPSTALPAMTSPSIALPAMVPPPRPPPSSRSPSVPPPAMQPPAMVAPPPAFSPAEALAVVVAPPPSPPLAPAASAEQPLPAASAEAVALDTEANKEPKAAAPPPTEVDGGLRATVLSRLRARETIADLALADADLSDLDLTGARLNGANLKGTKLARAVLVDARLGDAQLVGADLTDAVLTGADLTRADLTRAVVAGARFDGAILAETNLSSARGPGASFQRVTGRRAVFARGVWDGASFAGMDMMAADFTGSSLAKTDLKGASLIDARLDDARGEGACFDGAKIPQAHAQGAALTQSSFKDVDAPGSNWEKATLSDSTFAGANLKGASFLRATCLKTVFAGAELGGANMQRLNGDGADLTSAKLEGADLRQARLQEAVFNGASMQRVNANKADLTRSRFVGADLAGANLRASKLKGASLVRAQLDATDLRDADLEQANVFGASRQTAKMSGASTKDLVEVDPGEE